MWHHDKVLVVEHLLYVQVNLLDYNGKMLTLKIGCCMLKVQLSIYMTMKVRIGKWVLQNPKQELMKYPSIHFVILSRQDVLRQE